MWDDIQTAIPLGFFLSFVVGPVFFVLLETSVTKGFRAATVFDSRLCVVLFGLKRRVHKLRDAVSGVRDNVSFEVTRRRELVHGGWREPQ